MGVLTFETCEILKQVTSSWPIFIQQVSELRYFQQEGEQNQDIITYIKWEYRYVKGGTK